MQSVLPPRKVVLDSSVLFELNKKDWDFIKKHTELGVIQVWDSPVGLIELIRHIHQPGCTIVQKDKWVADRCSHLQEVAPLHMLPSPGLVVRRAIQEWLKANRFNSDVDNEVRLYLNLRKTLLNGQKTAGSNDIIQELLKPTDEISKEFQESLNSLRSEMHSDYVDKVRQEVKSRPGIFRNILVSYIQKDPGWQRSLFLNLIEHHGVGEFEKAAIALEWRNIPFIQNLLSIYCLQIGRFVDTDRLSVTEDFIDFEWAAYISSSRIDFFVTNNERDFQRAFMDAENISPKIKTWEQFMSVVAETV